MRELLTLFARDRRGSVSIIAAIALPVMLGFVALVAEYGHGLVTKASNQRVADLAAYAGALAYNAAGNEADMNAAVASVVALNGIAPGDATASLIPSPRGNGNEAVSVLVSTENTLLLAPILGVSPALPVSARAAAEVQGGVPGCIIALDPAQSGVTLQGGTSISAPECSVSSNSSVTAPCGTGIEAAEITYDGAAPTSCGNLTNADGGTARQTKKPVEDPLLTHAGVGIGREHLEDVADQSGPSLVDLVPVTVPASSINFNFPYWEDPNFKAISDLGCTGSYASGWTINCPYGRTYNIGEFKAGGGMTVTINLTGSPAPTTFNFSKNYESKGVVSWPVATYNFGGNVLLESSNTFSGGTININGNLTIEGNATFGPGTYNIVGSSYIQRWGTKTFGAGIYNFGGGLYTEGSSILSFGAGTFNFGSGVSCNSGTYSLCNTSSGETAFAGPSTFVLEAGVYNGGGSTLTMGTGTSNSFDIGPSSNSNSVSLGGGAKTIFGDALGETSLFRLTGNFNTGTGGGSCTRVSAAAQHDINGYVSAAGGVIFGSGVYTIDGYMAFGANSGGNVNCWGNWIGVQAVGVTFFVSGSTTACEGGRAFCVGAGYSSVTITAPTTGDMAKLAVVGPASPNTAGALFSAGASNTSVSGAFYFPTGPVDLSGGAGLGNGTGQCLQLVGSRVTMNGGSALASSCVNSATSGGSVALVQ